MNEGICGRCSGKNPLSWCAESPLWNEIMRNGDINNQDEYDFICPNCFMQLGIDRGIANIFRITAPETLVDLKEVTPSGRLWDKESFLWKEVPNE